MIRVHSLGLTAVVLIDIGMPWQAQLAVLVLVCVLGFVVHVIREFSRYRLGKLALEKTDPSQVADVVAAVINK